MSYIGSDKIGGMYLGSTSIAKAYLGSDLVFEKASGGLPSAYTQVSGLRQNSSNKAALALTVTLPCVAKLDVTPITLAPLSSAYSVAFGRDSNLQLGWDSSGNPYIGNNYSSVILLSAGTRYTIEGCFSRTASEAYFLIDGVDMGIKRKTSATTLYALGGGTTSYIPNAYLHTLQIYNGGTLTMDFVPCKRNADSVYGLYDLVGGTFYATNWIE